ncbi:MAG: hypothetical protein QNK54_03685 [Candidatus Planktophila sp.]
MTGEMSNCPVGRNEEKMMSLGHPYFDDEVSEQKSSKKGSLTSIVAILAIAVGGGFFLQNTLAANITLNSSAAVEFGQGVAITSACDSSGGITVNPSATYVNASGAAGSFKFGAITFSGIDYACNDKLFTVRAYGNAGDTPVVLNTVGTTFNYATFVFSSAGNSAAKSGNITLSDYAAAADGVNAGSLKVNFADDKSDPAQVYKITLESSAS